MSLQCFFVSCYTHSSVDFNGRYVCNKRTNWTDSILTYMQPKRALLSALRIACQVMINGSFHCYLIRRLYMKKLEHILRVNFLSESKRIYEFRIPGTRSVPYRHHGDSLPSNSPIIFSKTPSNFALEERTTVSGELTDVQTSR